MIAPHIASQPLTQSRAQSLTQSNLRRFSLTRPALLLLASLVLAALGAARDKNATDSRGVYLSIAQAPDKAREAKNPYQGDPNALLAGKKLYVQHCSKCHGTNARGMRNAVNLRTPAVQNATPGELQWFLRNGSLFHGMPSWSGLPEQRRWQIVTYLKSLR
jgi:mono/diheme cytochrome c family protein